MSHDEREQIKPICTSIGVQHGRATIQRNLTDASLLNVKTPSLPRSALSHHPGCHPPETGGDVGQRFADGDALAKGLRKTGVPIAGAVSSGFPAPIQAPSGDIDFL